MQKKTHYYMQKAQHFHHKKHPALRVEIIFSRYSSFLNANLTNGNNINSILVYLYYVSIRAHVNQKYNLNTVQYIKPNLWRQHPTNKLRYCNNSFLIGISYNKA